MRFRNTTIHKPLVGVLAVVVVNGLTALALAAPFEDVTDSVIEWCEDGQPNNGWLLRVETSEDKKRGV